MNEENEPIADIQEEPDERSERSPFRRPMYMALSLLGLILVGIILIWMFRGDEGGTVVSPPRTVSFGENDTGQPTGEQTITIAPDQIDKIGLKIETVGETPSPSRVTSHFEPKLEQLVKTTIEQRSSSESARSVMPS